MSRSSMCKDEQMDSFRGKHYVYLLIFIFIIDVRSAFGYKTGAPPTLCLKMMAFHNGNEQQSSPSPFTIELSSSNYQPGQEINVTISATDSRLFKGLMVRAHSKVDYERTLGSFTKYPTEKVQLIPCLELPNSIATHRNNDTVSSVGLTWKAPDENFGDITFVATVVENYETFWRDVTAALPAATQDDLIEIPQPPSVSTAFDEINWAECGETKGCFLYPKLCGGSDCYSAVSYRTVEDRVYFEMFATAEGYVSVGFSDDRRMTDDETISCTAQGDRVTVQHGYNPLQYAIRIFRGDIMDMQTMQRDGKIFCRFSRPTAMNVITEFVNKTFDLNNEHYMMIAWGYTYVDTDVMNKHTELPTVSDSKVDFQSIKIVRGSSMHQLTQLHGSLMLTAWILFVGSATVLARHYKEGFRGKTILGLKVWFQLHRASAITAWILTAVAFVIIFVHLGKLSEAAEIHSYIGITIMAASTLQVLAGLFRPGLESKVRPAFNWGHWFFGKASHILAAIAFMFAFNSEIIPQNQTEFGVIVIAVWIGLQVIWEVTFEIRKCFSKGSEYDLKTTSTSQGMSVEEKVPTSRTTRLDTVLLILYLITVLAMTVVSICAVVLF